MKPTEFDRWKDFARRMAYHGWPEATDERKAKIAHEVDLFVDGLEDYISEINDWDGNKGSVYVCDELSMFLSDRGYFHEDPDRFHRFETQISCCVRSGFDVAVAPSAGVLGFTVGTLRKMYDNEIPEWVAGFFTPPLTDAAKESDGVWL